MYEIKLERNKTKKKKERKKHICTESMSKQM